MPALRPSLLMAPAAALLLGAAPLPAQDPSGYEDRLDEAMATMRLYLTCSAFDPETHEFLREYWHVMTEETLAWLEESGIVPANLDALKGSILPGGLMPAPGTPFADVRAYCLAAGDWMARVAAFDLPQLPHELHELGEEDAQ